MMQLSEETISAPDQFEGAHRRAFDLRQIFLFLVLLLPSMCGAYYMAWVAAKYGSVPLFPVPIVIIAHALHLGLHALKKCGFICEESYGYLSYQVKIMGLFGNFFVSRPTFFSFEA